jgi:hypothetical protein
LNTKAEPMQPAAPGPTADSGGSSAQAAYLDAGNGHVYLVPGRRITIGSAASCDLVVQGPGISPKHARVYLRPDGQLSARPIGHRHLRVEGSVVRRPTPFAPGSKLGVGLHEIETGATADHFYLHLLGAWREARGSLRALRRGAKWGLFSAALHLILFVIALPWLLEEIGRQGPERYGALQMEGAPSIAEEIEDNTIEDVDDVDVPEPEFDEIRLEEPELDSAPVPLDKEDELLEGDSDLGIGREGRIGELSGADLFANITGRKRKGGDGTEKGKIGGHEIKNRDFARTVSRLRARGFELVFAFDSTGSMSATLSQAKQEMQKMLDLLRAVAPDLRVGIVTYRDQQDEYLVRTLPLGSPRYATLAFLSSISAGGGGDQPEAVDAAMKRASELRWRRQTVKALVIIGDAGPHEGRATSSAISLARRMRGKMGRVHVVSTTAAGQVLAQFERIAKAGNGEVLRLSDSRQLAGTLLSAALGRESEEDLDALLRAQSRERPGGLPPLPALLRNLEESEPDPDIIEAWRHAEASDLDRLRKELGTRRTSAEGRMALVYLINLWAERARIGSLLAASSIRSSAATRRSAASCRSSAAAPRTTRC